MLVCELLKSPPTMTGRFWVLIDSHVVGDRLRLVPAERVGGRVVAVVEVHGDEPELLAGGEVLELRVRRDPELPARLGEPIAQLNLVGSQLLVIVTRLGS